MDTPADAPLDAAWFAALEVEDLDLDAVTCVKHAGHVIALYRSSDGSFYATDDTCTHGRASLSEGFVVDTTIECPRHFGRFDFPTGEALGAPVSINVQTFATKVENGTVFVRIG